MGEREVPLFKVYFSTPDQMNLDQRRFYEDLVSELEKGHYPDVDGQISYLFAYTYTQLEVAAHRGFEWVEERLLELAEAYHHEESFARYCWRWGLDCLIGQGAFERFLEVSEPDSFRGFGTHFANLRCNVAYHIDAPPSPFDLLQMYSPTLTTYTRRNIAPFRETCEDVIAEHEQEVGPVLQWLLDAGEQPEGGYHSSLFQGAPIKQPRLPFTYWSFYSLSECGEQIRALSREAENRLRDRMKVPRVGEGWVSETELFKAVEAAFPQTPVIQHGRPPWLGRQHLDVWLPRWKVAVEYHGRQHFEPVEFFGGQETYEATVERDARKASLCEQAGVTLIVATEETFTAEVIKKVEQTRPE